MALGISLRRRRPEPHPAIHAGRLAQLGGRPYQLASDAWEISPTFGFDSLADAIAKVILESEPQLTLAIYGKWGVGKTTLLRAIDQRISEQCVVAWFDMWEFKNQEHVIAHLLDAIADVLPQGTELARGLRKLSRVALASASLTAGSVSLSGKDLLSEIDNVWSAPKVETRQLARLVEGWRAPDEGRRIVVIVDNLDRVLADHAVALLDQITSLFGFPGVVFLVGADGERLAAAVEEKHRLPEGEGVVYLEKVVQAEFQVPGLHREQVVRWVQSLTDQRLDLSETEARLLAKTAEWNPRQIKRLLNNTRIQLCTARYDVAEDEGLTLASTLLLHHDREAWLALTSSQATPRQVPQDRMTELVEGILGTRGGKRLQAMDDDEMQQFLSSSLTSLTIRSSEDRQVKASVQKARLRTDLVCDLYLAGRGLTSAIGLVGSVTVLEERGYAYRACGGSSGGALLAALLAVGYTPAEIREMLLRAPWRRIAERRPGGRLRGGPLRLDFFRDWVGELLASRGVETFGALRVLEDGGDGSPGGYRLAVIAADATSGTAVALPAEFLEYGLDPDKQPLADAVLAAVATPGSIEPLKLKHDGQVSKLEEFGAGGQHPIWLFDRLEGEARWPTFGVVVVPDGEGAAEVAEVAEADRARTIAVPAMGTSPRELDLAPDRTLALYTAGRSAAEEFLATWDFDAYLRARRAISEPSGAPAPPP
jgi:NTE family protein